jgi:ribosomal protein L24E
METLAYPKETKAIKVHICNFCSLKIPKGDTYVKSTHKYDGKVYDWKSHKHCTEIALRLKMHDHCDEGVTQDDFMETIHCEHDDILISMIPIDNHKKYSDIIQQLRRVNFRDKLGYVIRHYKKIDNATKNASLTPLF